jgi:class 3 adenylate cyclase
MHERAGRAAANNAGQALIAAIRWRSEMPKLPTGTVTFMFTDIDGSTRVV